MTSNLSNQILPPELQSNAGEFMQNVLLQYSELALSLHQQSRAVFGALQNFMLNKSLEKNWSWFRLSWQQNHTIALSLLPPPQCEREENQKGKGKLRGWDKNS